MLKELYKAIRGDAAPTIVEVGRRGAGEPRESGAYPLSTRRKA